MLDSDLRVLAPALLAATTALLLFVTIGRCIYNIFSHPLSRFPGPLLARSSRVWYARSTWRGTIHLDVKALHDRYGPVVRIAPDELAFSDSSAWKDIYTHATKSRQAPIADPVYYNVIFDPGSFQRDDGREGLHDLVRKLLNPGFSPSALREQQPLIERYADLFISKIGEASNGGDYFLNAAKWYEYVTLDIISTLAFGQSFNTLQSTTHHSWPAAVPAVLRTNHMRQALWHIYPGLEKAVTYGLNQALAKQRQSHFKMVENLVEQRLAMSPEQTDFVHKVIEPENGLTMEELIGITSFLMVAGSETTATALAGLTSLLCRNPEAMASLKAEVRDTFARSDDITCESVKNLAYVGAVIQEGLRIFPPASYFPRRTPPEGCLIAGTWVPGDTAAVVVQWAAYHSAANFTDPDKFVPERWLSDERYKDDRRDVVMPFSVGPRSCIGINLAYLELRLVLAKVMWHFDLALQKPNEDWTTSLKLYTTFEKTPLMVRMTPVARG